MKERPILFSGTMVRAILDGRKTQTRRVVKLPHDNPLGEWEATTVGGGSSKFADGTPAPEMTAIWHTRTGDTLTCPHGQPGDRLWVRETWKPRIVHSCFDMACDCETVWVDYPAGGEGRHFEGEAIPDEWFMPQAAIRGQSVPSLHMPRWASRLVLEITGVRVERLNDCSEADALAEGVSPDRTGGHFIDTSDCRCASAVGAPAVDAFRTLWDSINDAGAWEANPWVWVVEFKQI